MDTKRLKERLKKGMIFVNIKLTHSSYDADNANMPSREVSMERGQIVPPETDNEQLAEMLVAISTRLSVELYQASIEKSEWAHEHYLRVELSLKDTEADEERRERPTINFKADHRVCCFALTKGESMQELENRAVELITGLQHLNYF